MKVAALLPVIPSWLEPRLTGSGDVDVTGITHDSRAVAPGDVFACLRGEHADGHEFAEAAVAAGATALLVDHHLPVDVPQLVVRDTRAAIGPVSAVVHGRPSDDLVMIGITGTNGKTTTAHLMAAITEAAGWPTTVIGTLSGSHTTPEAPELQARLAEARRGGDRAVVMEVSSHALALHRADGTRFAAAVFTNLGIDHLDLHRTVEEYFRAKARLFTPELAAIGVTNVDDPHGRLLLDSASIEMVPYSRADVSDVAVDVGHHAYTWRGRRIEVALGGGFNVLNSLAAATTAATLGIDLDVVVAGLAAAGPVPGRFERVGTGAGPTVVVDYAHTPDGLEEVIGAARGVATGRVIVVFGCGGDRDRTKRPKMGAVAARLADAVVVTSDNPRSEDPAAILSDVMGGVAAADRGRVTVDPDRVAAIRTAIDMARPDDVVVVAGKGHERTQTIGDEVIDLDDRVVVREILESPR